MEPSLFPYIQKLLKQREDLTPQEIEIIGGIMLSGKAEDVQVAALLTLLHCKGASPQEVYAFAKVLRDHATPIHTQTNRILMDTCGTGGDHLNTFNISTTAMFILASAGIPIAKHGNKGITSKSGSSDVLEALGIKIDAPPEKVSECIEKTNIGFMFAPLYHASMKHLAHVRQNLPFRTVFNIIGPLSNPAHVQRQVMGVYHPDLLEIMPNALLQLGIKRALVFSGYVPEVESYMDEISPFGITHCAEVTEGKIQKFSVFSKDFGIKPFKLKDILGGTAGENARLTENILLNKELGPPREVVKLNAAAGLYVAGQTDNLVSGFYKAEEILSSGKPYEVLQKLRDINGI